MGSDDNFTKLIFSNIESNAVGSLAYGRQIGFRFTVLLSKLNFYREVIVSQIKVGDTLVLG